MNSEIYIKGIVTVNFDMAIDQMVFALACNKFGLNADNYQEFTESNWVALRGELKNEIYARPGDMEIVDITPESVHLDKIDFLDDEHYEVMFTVSGDAVQSIEKDSESLTVKL
jgi:hypothetical protein